MLLKILLIILGLIAVWQGVIRLGRRILHSPCPSWLGFILDTDYRRKLQKPSKIIERSGIKKGMKVLEIGCGSGAFTTFVAREVSKEGKVYALDIQPKMLEQLRKKLAKNEHKDIKNIEIIEANAQKLPFEDNSMDLVYMVTVLPEIPNQHEALLETKRVLRPGGILAVTEFMVDPDYPLMKTVVKQGEKAGFVMEEKSGNMWHYTVRFKKP